MREPLPLLPSPQVLWPHRHHAPSIGASLAGSLGGSHGLRMSNGPSSCRLWRGWSQREVLDVDPALMHVIVHTKARYYGINVCVYICFLYT